MKRSIVFGLLIITSLVLCACGSKVAETPVPSPTNSIAPTNMAPENTRLPTTTATAAPFDLASVKENLNVEEIEKIQTSSERISSLALSPDGKLLAYSNSDDNLIRLVDMSTGEEVATLEGHTAPVSNLVFSPDGKLLASGNTTLQKPDDTVRLWDVQTETQLASLENTGVYNLVFSPDGSYLAGEGDGIIIWDGKTLSEVKILENSSGKVSFSPDNTLLAVATDNDGLVHIVNMETGEDSTLPSFEAGPIWVLAFSPTSNLLASGNEDTTIQIWDHTTGEKLTTLKGHKGNQDDLIFSPDGGLLASLGSGVFFSRSGGQVSASRVDGDSLVRFWNVETGKQIGTIESDANITSMSFARDWSIIATGNVTGVVQVWQFVP
jgi:WD40 repeat protein